MLFNSSQYLLFFPVVVCLYFALPHRFRWVMLLVASYYFYMCWRVEYVFLIIISTLIDYGTALLMASAKGKGRRRTLLAVSLAVNLGLLFFFKYFNFVNDAVRAAFMRFNVFYGVPSFEVLLPVGISFYTFQTLSYTIDVYRKAREPEKHLGVFALYVAFFPQLVAGPIERSVRLLPQFFEKHGFSYERTVSGLRLMLWGFFKKVVIADRLAQYVNTVYNDCGSFQGPHLLVASYLFAFQIFCDFSGYSDIAIGSARVMGFRLMKNFDSPYFSQSIPEFWRRWHISLSTWFRDYVYIPLGGNRVSSAMRYRNLLVTFILSGIWHGANWTFFVWGGIHGLYIVFSHATVSAGKRIASALGIATHSRLFSALRIGIVFNLVVFAWIFFRASSVQEAIYIVTHLLTGWSELPSACAVFELPGQSAFYLYTTLCMIAVMEAVHAYQLKHSITVLLQRLPLVVRWGIYAGLFYAILVLGYFGQINFIYFQF